MTEEIKSMRLELFGDLNREELDEEEILDYLSKVDGIND